MKKIKDYVDKIDDELSLIGTVHKTPFPALAGRVGSTVNEVGGILRIGDNTDSEIRELFDVPLHIHITVCLVSLCHTGELQRKGAAVHIHLLRVQGAQGKQKQENRQELLHSRNFRQK